jgi:heme/copper-type cytochrome/quinol oxidase subunit 3
VLIVVIGMIFSCMVFSYLYLWSVQPADWPPLGTKLPGLFHSGGVLILLAGSGGLLLLADRMLTSGRGKAMVVGPLMAGLLLLATAIAGDIWLWTRIDLWPSESSFAAATFALGFLNGQNLAMIAVMSAFIAVRILVGRTDKVRRLSFDTLRLLWLYAIGQAAVTVAVAHGFPRLVS